MIQYDMSKEEYEFISSLYEVKTGELFSKASGKPINIISSHPEGDKVRITVSPDVRRRVYVDAIKSVLHHGVEFQSDDAVKEAILFRFKTIEEASLARNDSRTSIRMGVSGERIRVPYHIVLCTLNKAGVPARTESSEVSIKPPKPKPKIFSKDSPKHESPQQKTRKRMERKAAELVPDRHNTVSSEKSLSMKAIYHGPIADVENFNKMFDEVREVVIETASVSNGVGDIDPYLLARHLVNDVRPELHKLLESWVKIIIVAIRMDKI